MKVKALLLTLIGATFTLPFFGSTFVLALFILVLMNITFAQSWNILAGFTGLFSFGHLVYFGIGAYIGAILLRDLGLSPFLMAPLAGLFTMVLAVAIGIPCIRTRGFYFAIVTSALCMVVELVVTIMPWTGGATGIVLPSPPFDPKTTNSIFYVAMLIMAIVTCFAVYKISNSKLGIGLKAIREDETAARGAGVPIGKLKLSAMGISAFFPGVVGCIYAYYMTYIDPTSVFNLWLSFQAIMMVLLGGRGTIMGPILGAIIFTLASEFFRYTIAYGTLHAIIFGVLIIFIVLFMPQGIVGWGKQRFKKKIFI